MHIIAAQATGKNMMMMANDEELLLQFSSDESKVAPLRSTLILLSQGVVDWTEDCLQGSGLSY